VWIERIRFVRVAVNVEQLLYRAPGGTGRYTSRLVSLLSELFPDDTVVPFTARHGREEVERAFRSFGLPDDAAGQWTRLPISRRVLNDAWNVLNFPSLPLLSTALRDIDLVHAPSVAVPPRSGAPLVVTVHDAAPALFPETFPWHGRWFHLRGFEAAARRADLVITVSQTAAAEIAAHTTIPAGLVRVVPNGVDHIVARPDEVAAVRSRYGLGDSPYVVWVGSFEPRKNVGVLADAFSRLVSRSADPADRAGAAGATRGDLLLVLVGPAGWVDDDLIASSVKDRLGSRLRRLGSVAYAELRALYAGAEVFAFPSRHEGFGLPVLEAMVQNTPVVAADIPALREVAGNAARFVACDDVDGWVDALESLLGDPAACAALAAAGQAQVAAFSWEKTVRATRAVYVEALGTAG
jgi:glycosyltransferase involved in cell wall biosynthesis